MILPAGFLLLIIFSVALAKTVAVVDAVLEHVGVVHRAATILHTSRLPASPRSPTQRSSVRSSVKMSPGRASGNDPLKLRRSLHLRLISMHVFAVICQGAAVAKYILPVSDTSCLVTHRIMASFSLLYDASLVLFLLAKARVTRGNGALPCWEKGIIWWSRAYGWLYLPLASCMLSTTLEGSANTEGTSCFNGLLEGDILSTSGKTKGYGANNGMLIIQFLLLLVLFVKPMRATQGSTQSGGELYRRIIVRNVASTACIVATYAITTVVVVFAILWESPENSMPGQLRDMAIVANTLVTLCLTEIALPLGFISCWKVCATTRRASNQPVETDRRSGGICHHQRHDPKVAPIEETTLAPQTP